MEICPESSGLNIKEEPAEFVPGVVIKPEPCSPEPCTRVHPPLNSAEPPQPSSYCPPHPSSRPVGRFAPSKVARNSDKAVDLSTYQYGLYSFFAEGNENREYDAPHFDPHFGETDMKDPALLARAKRYFENLRRERCETEVDEYDMREQTTSTTREHRPMYQRKRKKLQRLVVLVPKIRISPTIQEYLRRRYPPDSDRAARRAARKKCSSAESTLQEEKLQEFMTQFQSGASHSKSRPYSVSQRVARMESQCRPPSSCSSQQSSLAGQETAASVRSLEQELNTPISSNTESANRDPLAPINRLIKSEPMDYEEPQSHENPLMAVKREMVECPHHNINSQIKSEPIDYSETDCIRHHSENCSVQTPLFPEDKTIPAETELSGLESPSTLPSQNSENITPNIQPTDEPPPGSEEENRRKKKKHKKPCIPFSIKQEPVEETSKESTLCPSLTSSATDKQSVSVPKTAREAVIDESKKKKLKRPCVPFPIKQEPIDPETASTEPNLTTTNSQQPEGNTEATPNVDQTETVKIKQEQLEPEQMLMVEIFRKRVKKLKQIEVKPLLAVKEEQIDFEDQTPEIKQEPEEAKLLYIKPKPVQQKPAKKLKYVYGRRMQGRARMSASHPRGRTSLDVMELEESEFDSAAKIDTPFSPPKSAWSKITPTVSKSPESDEETEENRGLTAQIDRLIEAGNIQTLDDTETMYSLFASTIKDIQDPKANVFNIVLERFKENKAFEKSMKSAEESTSNEPESNNADDETAKPPALVTLFPMSDQEIYNQGLAVVGETKSPEEFELPTVKVEAYEEEEEGEEKALEERPGAEELTGSEPVPQVSPAGISSQLGAHDVEQHVENPDLLIDTGRDFNPISGTTTFIENPVVPCSEPNQVRDSSVNMAPNYEFSRMSPIRIRNSLERLSKPNILKPSSANLFQPDLPTTSTSDFEDKAPPLYIDTFPKIRRGSDEKIRVVDENSEDYRETGRYKPEDRAPISMSRQKGAGDMSEAERLFDEMLADEQATFPPQEPTYMEPFPRNDTLFANTSLDDFIKAPLTSNEHLVKPKPSYVRMSYHDSSESVDTFKPPTVLFSSKPEDLAHKENAEWSQWRRHHESFDQFQTPSWGIDEQSNSWSPQHSLYDNYLEPPSTSAPFEEHQKEGSRINCFENSALSPWIEGRRLSVQSTYPIVERNQSGQEIVRIPVELRTVGTQFPVHGRHCLAVEVSPPILTPIVQRQDNVADISTQTDLYPPYQPYPDYSLPSPLSSVLVEPLLSARKVSRPSPRTPGNEDMCRGVPTVEQRTCQTQYPANNTLYSPFEPSVPFRGHHTLNREPADSCTQTEGAPLFPPWVAPGRFRRHRPVLVEPLPNIEPIGENVRTMRSSDAYSILMEQIRTSNDPSFDKFMNSQQQPNGVVSKFNKYACYAPQGNSPELPLTVKKNYPKKNGNVCKGKRPGIEYKEVSPQQVPSEHSNRGLTPYQISVKIRRMGQVENIIGRLSTPKKRKSLSPKR